MNMKFTTPELEMELLETVDVIATSPEEETTVSPIEPSKSNDLYQNDKW